MNGKYHISWETIKVKKIKETVVIDVVKKNP